MNIGITISLAQIPVVRGDVYGNLQHHLKMIQKSSFYNAHMVVFPELSLTGYELDLLSELALSADPKNFNELSQASVENDIIVIAGYPLTSYHSTKPTIGSVICFPDGAVQFYSKQHLHSGEEKYCSSGATDYLFNIEGYQVALSICADFSKVKHSQQARKLGADIYVVSALISDNGFVSDAKILSDIAFENSFPVLLSNHISKTGGWDTCGKNSIWNSDGDLVASTGSKDSCVLLCTVTKDKIEAVKK